MTACVNVPKKTNRLSIIVVVVVVVRELKQINGQCVLSHTSRSEPSECLYINFHNRHILKWASNVILLTDDKSHRSCECGERSFVIKKIFLFYNVWRWKSANEQNALKQTKIWIIFFCRWDSIVSFAQNKTENIHDNKKKHHNWCEHILWLTVQKVSICIEAQFYTRLEKLKWNRAVEKPFSAPFVLILLLLSWV